MKIKVVNNSSNELPKFATEDSAGMDLRANLMEEITINPGQRRLVSTGIKMAIPQGYEAQIRPRSGLAIKYGVTVLNSPGTIDADYRGDVGVILINLGQNHFSIKPGDRIAQMVITKYERFDWNQSDDLDETLRGGGGFGHSGNY
jgi:dUTP pyrophosphatase